MWVRLPPRAPFFSFLGLRSGNWASRQRDFFIASQFHTISFPSSLTTVVVVLKHPSFAPSPKAQGGLFIRVQEQFGAAWLKYDQYSELPSFAPDGQAR
jgi:hypothetical protein